MSDSKRPFVSVIIPVLNDAERLRLCLGALAQQTYSSTDVEVLVIDNDSRSLAATERAIAPFGPAKLSIETTPGSYAARNHGLSLAKGDILAFTDADCIPAPDWLEQGVKALTASPPVDMVVGPIEIFARDGDRPNLLELYQLMVSPFPQETYLRQFNGGATANILVRRAVVDRVGPFNQQLKSFGDLEWGARIFAAGYRQQYVPAVRVRHPARHSWQEIIQKNARVSGGVYDRFMPAKGSWRQYQKALLRLVWDDFFYDGAVFFTILRHRGLAQPGQKVRLVLLVGWLRCLSAMEKIRLHFGGVSRRF